MLPAVNQEEPLTSMQAALQLEEKTRASAFTVPNTPMAKCAMYERRRRRLPLDRTARVSRVAFQCLFSRRQGRNRIVSSNIPNCGSMSTDNSIGLTNDTATMGLLSWATTISSREQGQTGFWAGWPFQLPVSSSVLELQYVDHSSHSLAHSHRLATF